MYRNAIYRKNLQLPVVLPIETLPAPALAPTAMNTATDGHSDVSVGIGSQVDVSDKSIESVQSIGKRMLEKMVKVPAKLSEKVSIKSHLSSATTLATTSSNSQRSPNDDPDDLDIDEVKMD